MIAHLGDLAAPAITAIGAVLGSVAAMLIFLQFRQTRYSEERHRVELDQSRLALEREIDRLHQQIYRDDGRWNELNHLLIDSVRNNAVSGKLKADPAWGNGGSKFLSSMGIDPSTIKIDANKVFVLTPFNNQHIGEYEIISDVAKSIGLQCSRGDEVKIPGSILPFIVRKIVESGLIIANINSRNANVFYELGIAQALGKPVIMISKSYGDLPFDLKQQQILLYENFDDLRDKLLIAIARSAASFD